MRTMKRILLALSLVAPLASCGAAPAYAEDRCGRADKMVVALEKGHQFPVGGGLVTDKVMVIIYATPDGSNWTVMSLAVDGSACVLVAGEQWFGELPEAPVPGERGA